MPLAASRQFARALAPIAIVTTGFALTLLVFYPGILNYDARYVFQDALNGTYGDWQSPVQTLIWAQLNRAIPGSSGMFLAIAATYWLGVLTLGIALARRSLFAAIGFCLLALSPPLFAFIGIVWRDIWMAGLWLLAAALTYATLNSRASVPARVFALVLVCLGFLLRPNALAAAPLLLGYLAWPRVFSWRRTVLLIVPAMIALFGLMQLIYYGALDAKRQHPLHSILMFDLGGITHFSKQNQFPASWTPEQEVALVTSCYDPAIWNVYWNGDCQFVMKRIENELALFGTPALGSAWLTAVTSHPLAYLQHRTAFFWQLLAGRNPGMWIDDVEHPGQRLFADRPAFTTLVAVHDALQGTPLFRLGVWLLVNALACVLVLRKPKTAEAAFVIGISGSAIVYLLSFWPLGVAAEFRYGYVVVLAGIAGLIVALPPARTPAQ